METLYKGYIIKPQDNNPKSYLIKNATKGGSLPIAFDGLFTDRGTAQKAIDQYVERQNAKTSTKG